MSYAEDRAWSDRYLPIMRQLIGPHLLMPSPLETVIACSHDVPALEAA